MSDDLNPVPDIEEDPFEILQKHDLLRLFDELTFRQKWKRVFQGLKQPLESGEHKWARLQLLRLLSPFAAVLVPVLMLFLIALLAQFTPQSTQSFEVTVIEPTPMEDLEDIEQPEMEPLEPPDPVDIEVDVQMDVAPMPTDVAAPTAEDASVQPAEFDSVAQIRSPVVLSGMLGSRNPGTRGQALGRYGGGGHTEQAVIRALRWLAKNQRADGSWGNSRPAMTSLALLAYLGYGATPASEEFGQTIERGIRYLVGAQEDNGRFRGRDNHDYTQPIAAYALAEVYVMTKIPMVRDAALKALDVIVKGQNPTGSFDYNLRPSGSNRDDLSYAAWCVQALKAAEIAGLHRDLPGITNAMARAVGGVKGHFRQQGDAAGIFGYMRGGSRHPGLTGAGVLSMQFLGEGRARETRMGIAGMANYPFNWQNPPAGSIVYYWYYNTQAYFQEGGAVWDRWNAEFSRPLVSVQNVISREESGYVDHKGQPQETGFWESPAAREMTGGNGKVMDTILCTLMLEVYYRYLPTFQQVTDDEIESELGDEEDLIIEIVQTRPDIRELGDTHMFAGAR